MEVIGEKDFFTLETREKWNYILKKIRVHDIGQTYEYCSLWWLIFKDNVIKKSLLVVIDSYHASNAIWPLMLRKQYLQKGLHIIGQIDGFITDYAIPLLVDEKSFSNHLNEFVNFLKSSSIKWNYLKLNIPEWSNYRIKDLFSESRRSNLVVCTKEYDKYSIIHLNNDFESFLATLGTKTRADIRKYLRIIETGEFEFRVYKNSEIKERCAALIELNSQVWSVFNPKQDLNKQFMQTLTDLNTNCQPEQLILPILFFKGKALSAVIGYISNKNCFLHTAGVIRTKFKSLSPGIALYALIIKYLYDNRINTLDFSPGIEDYKLRLGSQIKTITQLVIFKNTYSKLIYKTGLNLLERFKVFKNAWPLKKIKFRSGVKIDTQDTLFRTEMITRWNQVL